MLEHQSTVAEPCCPGPPVNIQPTGTATPGPLWPAATAARIVHQDQALLKNLLTPFFWIQTHCWHTSENSEVCITCDTHWQYVRCLTLTTSSIWRDTTLTCFMYDIACNPFLPLPYFSLFFLMSPLHSFSLSSPVSHLPSFSLSYLMNPLNMTRMTLRHRHFKGQL